MKKQLGHRNENFCVSLYDKKGEKRMRKHTWNRIAVLALTLILSFGIAGCEGKKEKKVPKPQKTEQTTNGKTTQDIDVKDSYSLDEIPEYDGEPYVILDDNEPTFKEDEITDESYEEYSDLDELGRCGTAEASIGTDIMPTEERGAIGQVKPSGWHTVKYDVVDGKYLYNRCHLIGYQLTGENANEKNLITGTRYLNVAGMLPFEDMVADYVKETDNHVMYRLEPVFEGDNLVANGVIIEAYSVEDEGEGICFRVYCYNVQPDVEINYATGDSKLCKGTNAVSSEAVKENPSRHMEHEKHDTHTEHGHVQEYVLNKNTMKFHRPDCSSVKDIKGKNKKVVEQSREDLILESYAPCKRCNP